MIAERFISIVAEQLNIDRYDIRPDASLTDDLGADSLDIAELVILVNEEFDLDIPDEDLEKIYNVRQAIEYIESKVDTQSV